MIALLQLLLCASDKARTLPHLEPSAEFLPLQNLYLYFEAFQIEQHPLGAFRPLDVASLAWALPESRLFSEDTNLQPQIIEHLDRYIRKTLPIDCPRDKLVSQPGNLSSRV